MLMVKIFKGNEREIEETQLNAEWPSVDLMVIDGLKPLLQYIREAIVIIDSMACTDNPQRRIECMNLLDELCEKYEKGIGYDRQLVGVSSEILFNSLPDAGEVLYGGNPRGDGDRFYDRLRDLPVWLYETPSWWDEVLDDGAKLLMASIMLWEVLAVMRLASDVLSDLSHVGSTSVAMDVKYWRGRLCYPELSFEYRDPDMQKCLSLRAIERSDNAQAVGHDGGRITHGDGLSMDGRTLRWGGELFPLGPSAAGVVRLLVDAFDTGIPYLHEDYLKENGETDTDMRRLVPDNGLASVVIRQLNRNEKPVKGMWGLIDPKKLSVAQKVHG